MISYVPGEGPQPARGMIVGEAPGRTEAEQGRPFVGKSGILLDQALLALGVQRGDIYVTNVFPLLPLDGSGKIRRPTEIEMATQVGRLNAEVRNTKPKSILALGKTAENFLREHLSDYDAWNVVNAWHPSYVLRRHGGLSVEWLEQIRPWANVIH